MAASTGHSTRRSSQLSLWGQDGGGNARNAPGGFFRRGGHKLLLAHSTQCTHEDDDCIPVQHSAAHV